MKILWTVNTLSPDIASVFGVNAAHSISWVEAMSYKLIREKNIELAIASPASVDGINKKEIDGIIYYVLYSNKSNWNKVIDDFKPDIIHGYGTEKKHNIFVCDVAKNIPIIISLQGILNEYQRHYYGGIDMSTILRYTPIRDVIRPSGFITGRRDFKKRSLIEVELLKNVKYVEGRSTWDKVASANINPKLNYYYCCRMIRAPFYNSLQWTIESMKRHTIFVSQGDYPIKGIHFAFLALEKIKQKYPDVKLLITGNDMFSDMDGVKKFLKPGYKRYIYDLAKRLNILDNIEYVGKKTAEGMTELLRTANLAVIPSVIENAPNSLVEAMLVGTPCIATYVGGNMDILKHNEEGFLYSYNEPNMLAEYISRIFDSDDLAKKFSNNARNTALKRHDPHVLVNKLINIYKDVIEKEHSYE